MQLFNKKLRQAIGPFRFAYCGEYGGQTWRAHYHMVLFGHDFRADRVPYKQNKRGDMLYISETLNKIWGLGFCIIGDLTLQSASYVAGYVIKKINGKQAKEHYLRPHPLVGGYKIQLEPEFFKMSNRPGIGYQWFQQYRTDAFPSDFVVVNGKKMPIPRYYKRLLDREALLEGAHVVERPSWPIVVDRIESAQATAHDRTPERLADREVVRALKTEHLRKRGLSDD